MRKNLQLQINKPCTADWNSMKPNEIGRFCSSCSKTVVDFTNMSDREVIEWFAGSAQNTNTCGRLHQTQLKRALIEYRPGKSKAALFWNYLMAALLIGTETRAQTINTNSKAPTCQHDTSLKEIVVGGLISGQTVRHRPSIKDLPDTLYGRIVCTGLEQPIPFATITVSGGNQFMSDADGYFSIQKNIVRKPYNISISSIGSKPTRIDVIKTWRNGEDQTINIPLEYIVLGEMTTTVQISKTQKLVSLLKDSLNILGLVKKTIRIYPNPAIRGGTVTIEADLKEPGTHTLQLINLAGMTVMTMQAEGSKDLRTITMEIPGNISTGIYVLRILNNSQRTEYTRQVEVF